PCRVERHHIHQRRTETTPGDRSWVHDTRDPRHLWDHVEVLIVVRGDGHLHRRRVSEVQRVLRLAAWSHAELLVEQTVYRTPATRGGLRWRLRAREAFQRTPQLGDLIRQPPRLIHPVGRHHVPG